MKKLTIEYVRGKVEEIGYELLSEEYNGANTKLKVKCDKGHIYTVIWSRFRKGAICGYCSGRLKTIEGIKKLVPQHAPGYEVLSDVYINSHTKLKFKCDKGHEFLCCWGNFKQGNRCSVCANSKKGATSRLTISYIRQKVKELAPGFELLSTEYSSNKKTKLKFRCDKGHVYKSCWAGFYSTGNRCPICSGKQKHTIAFVKEKIEEAGYSLLSKKYKNTRSKLLLKCDKGHVYKVCFCSFQNGARCLVCHHISHIVHDETSMHNLHSYKIYVNRLSNVNFTTYYYLINPYKLKRSFTEHHLDHIYTVIDGFNNGILPQIIASPINLQMLTAHDNMTKNGRSDMTKEELFEKYNEFIKGEQNE